MIGTTLAHYKVTAALGEGGMGQVWRAEDEKLGREVALKVLPEEFAADPQRLERFEREAKVLASLNHANIATLYGLETAENTNAGAGSEGTMFLVMELVEGEDLSERIQRGAVPVDEAIPIAMQIAQALEAAHEAGIVHRDLKPANIKLSEDGTVKVLDFGLAKAWESEAGDESLSLSPTVTRHATAAGVILGTAAYMSPDQARGKKVDRRADIWAFGVVLWEMLTGQKLFEGDTVSDVLASVLKEEPNLEALPEASPMALRRLIARCLERDPKNRLQWIGDARLDLTDALDQEPAEARETGEGAMARRGVGTWIAGSAVAIAAVAALVFSLRSPQEPVQPLTRFSLGLTEEQTLSFLDQPILALAPDGQALAMTATDPEAARDVIVIRRFDEIETIRLDGTEGAGEMFFSPDGSAVGFFADGKLKRASIGGGSVVTLADAPTPRGGAWLLDGTIVFAPEYASGLWKVGGNGGAASLLVDVNAERDERTFRFPHATPDGEILLFTVGTLDSPNNYDNATIDAFSFETGERRTIIERANMARFAGRNRIVFARAGDLYAVGFDPAGLQTVGEAAPVIEDVGGDPSSGAGYFTIAENGTIAWLAGAVTASDALLTIVDRAGEAERVPLSTRGFFQPRFSPDGSRLAFTVGEGYSGVAGDVWVYRLATQALSRLTFNGNELYPLWSPDSRRIAYLSYGSEASIMAKPADGSGAEEQLTPEDTTAIFPESFTPDGRTLAFTRVGQTADIYLITAGEDARLFESQASSPSISPDGRWIAYASPGAGMASVFVRPLAGEGKWQVSPGLGSYPRWSRDGSRLFYIDIGTPKRPLMEVDVSTGESFQSGPPRVVVENLGSSFVTSTAPAVNWDTSPTGERFVFVEFERRSQSAAQIEIALNWAQHLDLDSK